MYRNKTNVKLKLIIKTRYNEDTNISSVSQLYKHFFQ